MSDPQWLTEPCRRVNEPAAAAARRRQDQLTKPRGSLGRLEELAVRLAGMQATDRPSPDPIYIMQVISDHGVAAEGTSLFPRSVSNQMLRNMANGGAAVNVFAVELDAEIELFDLGTLSDPGPLPGVISRRLGPGTANIAEAPALTHEQLRAALEIGRDAVERAIARGARLFIGGEMGIGNTTPATALACALLGLPARALTGPGTGLDTAGVTRKAAIVERALTRHAEPGCPPLELLRRLGGFDTAALTGAYLRAAQLGLAMLVDGFIVSAAALVAARLQPNVTDWMFFAHHSAEAGHRAMMDALHAEPLLNLGLRLGEATAAEVAVPLLRLACAAHNRMATFAEAGVDEAGT